MCAPKLIAALTLSALSATVLAVQAAQPAWPDKPIRLVVGSAAGSGPDIIARVTADRLYRAWGQRIVVDPRPGVAGLRTTCICRLGA